MKVFVRRFGSGFQRPREGPALRNCELLYCKDLLSSHVMLGLSGCCMNAGMRSARHIESTADLTSFVCFTVTYWSYTPYSTAHHTMILGRVPFESRKAETGLIIEHSTHLSCLSGSGGPGLMECGPAVSLEVTVP